MQIWQKPRILDLTESRMLQSKIAGTHRYLGPKSRQLENWKTLNSPPDRLSYWINENLSGCELLPWVPISLIGFTVVADGLH